MKLPERMRVAYGRMLMRMRNVLPSAPPEIGRRDQTKGFGDLDADVIQWALHNQPVASLEPMTNDSD